MEPNDTPTSHEESLQIINRMIDTARQHISDNGFHLLWWGWLVLIAALLQYALDRFTSFEQPFLSWLLMIPGAVVSFVYGRRQGRRAMVTSYTDQITLWAWVAVMISMIMVIVFGAKINYQITPLVLLFAGNATFITGWLLRFRPVRLGATALWGSAIAGFLVSPAEQPLVMAIAICLGYLWPGYLLRAHYRNQ